MLSQKWLLLRNRLYCHGCGLELCSAGSQCCGRCSLRLKHDEEPLRRTWSLATLFDGTSSALHNVCEWVARGTCVPFDHKYTVEINDDCDDFLRELQKKKVYAHVRSNSRHSDFLELSLAAFLAVVLLIITAPCERFSSLSYTNKSSKMGLDDAKTKLIMLKLLRLVKSLIAQFIIGENVMPFFSGPNDEAWKWLQAAANQAGYTVVYKAIDTTDLLLPVSSPRGFFAFVRGDVAWDQNEFDTQLEVAIEHERSTTLDLKAVRIGVAEHEKYRVSPALVLASKYESLNEREKLVVDAARAKVRNDGWDGWWVVNISMSDTGGFVALHATEGQCPRPTTVNMQKLFCLHSDMDRCFYPQEVGLILGFEQVPMQCMCRALGVDTTAGLKKMCTMLGRAASPCQMRCFVGAVMNTAPEAFSAVVVDDDVVSTVEHAVEGEAPDHLPLVVYDEDEAVVYDEDEAVPLDEPIETNEQRAEHMQHAGPLLTPARGSTVPLGATDSPAVYRKGGKVYCWSVHKFYVVVVDEIRPNGCKVRYHEGSVEEVTNERLKKYEPSGPPADFTELDGPRLLALSLEGAMGELDSPGDNSGNAMVEYAPRSPDNSPPQMARATSPSPFPELERLELELELTLEVAAELEVKRLVTEVLSCSSLGDLTTNIVRERVEQALGRPFQPYKGMISTEIFGQLRDMNRKGEQIYAVEEQATVFPGEDWTQEQEQATVSPGEDWNCNIRNVTRRTTAFVESSLGSSCTRATDEWLSHMESSLPAEAMANLRPTSQDGEHEKFLVASSAGLGDPFPGWAQKGGVFHVPDQGGDWIWMGEGGSGGIPVAKHIYPEGLDKLCAEMYNNRASIPWTQHWHKDQISQNWLPGGRMSCWLGGSSTHKLGDCWAKSVQAVVDAVLESDELLSEMGGRELTPQLQLYRGEVEAEEFQAHFSPKDNEYIKLHQDGPEVDHGKPIAHIYVGGEALVTLSADRNGCKQRASKQKWCTFQGRPGSVTIFAPGADQRMWHQRETVGMGKGDVGITIVLRHYKDGVIDSKYKQQARCFQYVGSSCMGEPLLSWNEAAGCMEDPLLVAARASNRIEQPVDWKDPSASRLFHQRYISGVVFEDSSITACILANEEFGNKVVLRQQHPGVRFTPGDVFAKVGVMVFVGMEPQSNGGAVKGKKEAGGVVSTLLTAHPIYVGAAEDWSDAIIGSKMVFTLNAHNVNAHNWCAQSKKSQKTVRVIATLPKWREFTNVSVYLGDAIVVSEFDGGLAAPCAKWWWTLSFSITSASQLELVRLWWAEYKEVCETAAKCGSCRHFLKPQLAKTKHKSLRPSHKQHACMLPTLLAHIACPPEQLVVVGGRFDATTANVTAPHRWHNDFAENYTCVEGESMPDFFDISPPCHSFTDGCSRARSDGCRGQYKGQLTYHVPANWPIQSLHWPTAPIQTPHYLGDSDDSDTSSDGSMPGLVSGSTSDESVMIPLHADGYQIEYDEVAHVYDDPDA